MGQHQLGEHRVLLCTERLCILHKMTVPVFVFDIKMARQRAHRAAPREGTYGYAMNATTASDTKMADPLSNSTTQKVEEEGAQYSTK